MKTSGVIWFTGMPSSGKSTLAEAVARRLREADGACVVLDGDAVRAALVPSPGYDAAGRDAFYATLGRLAALIAEQGAVVLVPATAHLARYRDAARAAAPRFVEVHVRTPAEECAKRDAKGLYARVRGGDASDLPGADLVYEPPAMPEVVAAGGKDDAAVDAILRLVRSWSR